MPARPSSAITETSGSSRSSSANRCSLLRGRSPHGSGLWCPSRTNSSPTVRTSADCEPERRTANSFSLGCCRRVDDRIERDGAGGVQAVDLLECGVDGGPADRGNGVVGAGRGVFGGVDAEVSGLDPQRGVVADHRGRAEVGLADRRADDPVVRDRRVEPVLDEQVLADVVDLDLQRGGAGAGRDRLGERAAVGHTQFLECAQRRAGGSSDVVGAALEAVEFLDHRQRDDDVDVAEVEHAARDRRSGPTCRARVGSGRSARLSPLSPPSVVSAVSRAATSWEVDRSVTITPGVSCLDGAERGSCATALVVAHRVAAVR